jgi:hypothetical protein
MAIASRLIEVLAVLVAISTATMFHTAKTILT